MFIVDAHLDIAYNAQSFGRDIRHPVAQLRQQEANAQNKVRGTATVALPEMQQGGVGLVFGTLFVAPATQATTRLGLPNLYYNQADAHKLAMWQLDHYHRLADETEPIRLVTDRAKLDDLILEYVQAEAGAQRPLGIVPLMEGADAIRTPEELEMWYERGLRIIGLAWDDTAYSAGAWRGTGDGLTSAGHHLLEVMADFGMILDLSHMSEAATHEALDRYEGTVIATHSNCRVLVGRERHFSDKQIRRLGERGGMMGIAIYNVFLKKGHNKGERRELVTVADVVAQIDHVCQILGSADHVGIGSDFDGGFGWEDIPHEMNSIADLGLIATKLAERGYDPEHIEGIMGENWVRVLREAWDGS